MAIADLPYDLNLKQLDIDILDEEREREIKLLILGEPNAGKSSLVQMFFNNQNPKEILENDIEPTYGAEIRVFEHKKATVGVFDLAGQELDRWLSDENAEMFYETDGILIFFNLDLNLKRKHIEAVINPLKQMLQNYAPKARCNIILNKYDEFIQKRRGSLKKANNIKQMVQEISKMPTYIASLIPNYYPLLKMKIDRLLESLPVEIPSFAEAPPVNERGILTPEQIHKQKYVTNGIHLAEAQQLPQSEYDRQISRSELMASEFAIR